MSALASRLGGELPVRFRSAQRVTRTFCRWLGLADTGTAAFERATATGEMKAPRLIYKASNE